MKKPLIAVAVSMALVSTVQAEGQFYGKMNVATVYNDVSEKAGVESYASRLGVKGSEDLGSTTVIYQAEFETDIDGDSTVFKQRDSYVGLHYAGMGTVKMGVMDTPLKKSQGKFDLFNDVVDISQVITGETRAANSLNYTTEKMGAVQVSASVVFAEDGTSDGYSANAIFNADSLYAAVAYDTKVGNESTVRATAIYNMGDLSFGALVNQIDSDDSAAIAADADELAYAVNAAMKAGSNTYKIQLEVGDQGKQSEVGGQSISVGADHKLAKTTKAYLYVNQFESDTTDSAVAVALGLEHKF
jgi:predicted porin